MKCGEPGFAQQQAQMSLGHRVHSHPNQIYRCARIPDMWNPACTVHVTPQDFEPNHGPAHLTVASSMLADQPVARGHEVRQRKHARQVNEGPNGRRGSDALRWKDNLRFGQIQPVASHVPSTGSGSSPGTRQMQHRLPPERRRQGNPMKPGRRRMAKHGIRQQLQVRPGAGREIPGIAVGCTGNPDSPAGNPQVRGAEPAPGEPRPLRISGKERVRERRRKGLRRAHPPVLPAGPHSRPGYPQIQTGRHTTTPFVGSPQLKLPPHAETARFMAGHHKSALRSQEIKGASAFHEPEHPRPAGQGPDCQPR